MKYSMMKANNPLIFLFLLFFNLSAFSLDLEVDSPVIKAPRPGQNISAGYVTLTSANDLKVKSIESSLMDKIEVHTMKMENDGYGGKKMLMRKIDTPQLIANKRFVLKPGADHLMFYGINEPIKAGDRIPLLFKFLDQDTLIEKTIIFNVI